MESLSRKELQALAKLHGIKANLKNSDIIFALTAKDVTVDSSDKTHGLHDETVVDQPIFITTKPVLENLKRSSVVMDENPAKKSKIGAFSEGCNVEACFQGIWSVVTITKWNKKTARVFTLNEEGRNEYLIPHCQIRSLSENASEINTDLSTHDKDEDDGKKVLDFNASVSGSDILTQKKKSLTSSPNVNIFRGLSEGDEEASRLLDVQCIKPSNETCNPTSSDDPVLVIDHKTDCSSNITDREVNEMIPIHSTFQNTLSASYQSRNIRKSFTSSPKIVPRSNKADEIRRKSNIQKLQNLEAERDVNAGGTETLVDVPIAKPKVVSTSVTSNELGLTSNKSGSSNTVKVTSESKIKMPSSYKASKAPDFSKAHENAFKHSRCITDIVERDKEIGTKMTAAFNAALNGTNQSTAALDIVSTLSTISTKPGPNKVVATNTTPASTAEATAYVFKARSVPNFKKLHNRSNVSKTPTSLNKTAFSSSHNGKTPGGTGQEVKSVFEKSGEKQKEERLKKHLLASKEKRSKLFQEARERPCSTNKENTNASNARGGKDNKKVEGYTEKFEIQKVSGPSTVVTFPTSSTVSSIKTSLNDPCDITGPFSSSFQYSLSH